MQDTTKSDGFLMSDPTQEASKWHPKSITQALKWKPPTDRRKKV